MGDTPQGSRRPDQGRAGERDIEDKVAALDRRFGPQPGRAERLIEADALARQAESLVRTGDWEGAARELGRAAELLHEACDFREESRHLNTQALLLSRLPGQGDRARDVWRRASGAAFLDGDLGLQLESHRRMAEFARSEQDWTQMLASTSTAIRKLSDAGVSDPEYGRQLVEFLRERGRAYQVLGFGEHNEIFLRRARDDLAQAVDVARDLGAAELALRVRLELRTLESVMPGAGAGQEGTPEPFAALRAEAESLGAQGLLGSVAMEQAAAALRGGQLEAAIEHAEAARQVALEGPDPVRYLLACMLVAEAREALGDRPGVIAVLLTCKKSLERFLGKDAGQPVTLVLDSLERRWGRAGVEEALRVYRAQMKDVSPA